MTKIGHLLEGKEGRRGCIILVCNEVQDSVWELRAKDLLLLCDYGRDITNLQFYLMKVCKCACMFPLPSPFLIHDFCLSFSPLERVVRLFRGGKSVCVRERVRGSLRIFHLLTV